MLACALLLATVLADLSAPTGLAGVPEGVHERARPPPAATEATSRAPRAALPRPTSAGDCPNCIASNISVGSAPLAPVLDNVTGRIYVMNSQSNNITVIDATTDKIVATIVAGSDAVGAAYDYLDGKTFVAEDGSNSVLVIEDSTDSVLADVAVGSAPGTPTFDPANDEIYVSNAISGTVSVLSGSSDAVIATTTVGTDPLPATLDPGNGELYVANGLSDNISILSGSTNKVVNSLGGPGVFASPFSPLYVPADGDLWLPQGSGLLSILSGSSGAVLGDVPFPGVPIGEAFDSGSDGLWLSYVNATLDESYAALVSVASDQVVTTIPLGAGVASSPTYDASNGTMFIASPGPDTLDAIPDSWPAVFESNPLPSEGLTPVVDAGNDQLFVSVPANRTVEVIDAISPTTVEVSASASLTDPYVDELDHFEGTAVGGLAPYSWAWRFGDGGYATGQNVTNAYAAVGTYHAVLWVNDSVGDSGERITVPIVVTTPLNAWLTASPVGGLAPLKVSFQGHASGAQPPYRWAWEFGDGGSSSGQNVSYTYDAPGVYSASLWVNDTLGQSSLAATTIKVLNATPLSLTALADPSGGEAPLTVSFTSSALGGSPPYQFSWEFGDGGTSTLESPQHTYETQGDFEVDVGVTDSVEDVAETDFFVQVNATGGPLVAQVIASPQNGVAPLLVDLTASVSGGTPPYTGFWSFGDDQTGTGLSVFHEYTSAGSYQPTIEVQDARGNTTYGSVNVLVSSTLRVSRPVADPSSGRVGQALSISVSATGGLSPYQAAWYLPSSLGCQDVGALTISCTPEAAGNFSLYAVVTDSEDGVASSPVVELQVLPALLSVSNPGRGWGEVVLPVAASASVLAVLLLWGWIVSRQRALDRSLQGRPPPRSRLGSSGGTGGPGSSPNGPGTWR